MHAENSFFFKSFFGDLCFLGDNIDVMSHALGRVPKGGIEHSPMLNWLRDALSLNGDFNKYQDAASKSSHARWFADYSHADASSPSVGVGRGKSAQSTAYNVFSSLEKACDLSKE